MARANTLRFSQFVWQFGDGATPENFSKPCGVTSRDFVIVPSLSATVVPDCDDDDAVGWVDNDTVSMSASGTISGTLDDDDYSTLLDWALSGDSRNAHIIISARLLTGAFKAELTTTGAQGKRGTFSVKLTSDGVIARVS
jgi:hypothetical protein